MACDHNCANCSSKENCGEVQDLRFPMNEQSQIRHVVAVVSGKGGVGKSTVTGLLALATAKAGYKTGILDADITGPSIPRLFGVEGPLSATDQGMLPVKSKGGVGIISANLLLPHGDDPVIWRGPLIAGVVKDFWSGTIWGDLDYLFVDMPPGTGDVPLTVFQSLPVDGCVVVTSPQQLVGMIVGKAVHMAGKMSIPILGLVENLAYYRCPSCGEELEIFGQSQVKEVANRYGLEKTLRLPIDPDLTKLSDSGRLEEYTGDTSALLALLSPFKKQE